MNSAVKVTGSILAIIAILVGGILAWARHEFLRNGERIRGEYEQGLARIRPAFLEDQELAKAYPVFASPRNERDAGPFLNPRIGWDGDHQRIERWRATVPRPSELLALDPGLLERIPRDWWTADRTLWSTLDFSWMAALREYDHWDVEQNSPWAELKVGEWPNGFPLFFELTPWSRLRLAKGRTEGHMKEAVADVEHLSLLLLSTETLLGAANALQQLGSVDRALAALEEGGEPTPRAANRIDAAVGRRLWRSVMNAPAFLRIETPVTHVDVRQQIRVGRCAALNEALHTALTIKPMVGVAQMDGLSRLEELMNRETGCRLSRIRRQWAGQVRDTQAPLTESCGRSQDYLLAMACRTMSALSPRAMDQWIAAEFISQTVLSNDAVFSGYTAGGGAPCKP